MALFAEELVARCTTSIVARLVGSHASQVDTVVLTSLKGWSLKLDACHINVSGDGMFFTFGHFYVSQLDGDCATLVPTPESFVMGHKGEPQFHAAFELCCGLGGLSQGASFAGMTMLGGVDVSTWATEVYSLNHIAPAFTGDIGELSTVQRLSGLIDQQSVGCLLGFPCPPFSSRGDQLGFADKRAWTLVHGLNAAYLLRSSFVLLECTPWVESFPQVVHFLSEFAKTTSCVWRSQILRLDRSWPTRRTRWWCMIFPEELDRFVSFEDLPFVSCFQSLDSLLPSWPTWPREQEEDLFWNADEMEFHQQYADLSDLCLQRNGKCPTLLHSLGHLDRKCPCGCRNTGLSHARLERDGICAIALRATHLDGLRHLHPAEAGLLCTLAPNFRFPAMRDCLPLIGQCAAPVQAHWMLTQFLRALQQFHDSDRACVDPCTCHQGLLHHLIKLAYHTWPTKGTQVPRQVTLRFDLGCSIVFEIKEGLTLEDLIQAQVSLGGWGQTFVVQLNGTQLPPLTILKPLTYDVLTAVPPTGGLCFVISFGHRAWTGSFAPGLTPEALLLSLGFSNLAGLRLVIDSMDVSFSSPLLDSFAGRLVPMFVGSGSFPHVGLSDVHIDAEAFRLFRLVAAQHDTALLSALDLSSLVALPSQFLKDGLAALLPACATHVFGIYCDRGHWAAISFDLDTAVARYYDGYSGITTTARDLIDAIADLWDLRQWNIQRFSVLQQSSGTHCGIIALANWAWYLDLLETIEETDAMEWYRRLMRPQFVGTGNVEYNRAHAFLLTELPKHGVDASEAPARAAAALKRLGTSAILKASEGKNPWQALKALGNANEKPFQWVTPAELDKHVEARAKDKRGPMPKPKKTSERRPKVLALTPAQVQIADGAFADSMGEPVVMIPMEGISHSARGVVLVTHDEACRFIVDGKTRSVDALALLTLSPLEVPPDCKLDVGKITWPGILVDSGEPLLIKGTCIQLGDIRVDPTVGSVTPSVVETDLLRIFVFRDQWPETWDRFIAGPLRALISHFPGLQFCDKSCADRCPKFHPAIEEVGINMVVLDAFAWTWYNRHGKVTPKAKADSFSLMIRVPRSGVQSLMNLSGTDGFYSELRDPEHRGSHPNFAVIWLSDDFDAAKHRLLACDKALHLVRYHNKYGLRCHKKDEAHLHQVHFPGAHFIDCGTSMQFEIGPFPYGATKTHIFEFLKGISWTAKPLKPTRGVQDGRFWLVGSSDEPPSLVAPYADRFVAITKVRDVPLSKPAPSVVASLKTLQRITGSAGNKANVLSNPWSVPMLGDPWKTTASQPASQLPTAAASSAASTKLEELEGRVSAKLVEQMHEQIKTVAEDSMLDTGHRLEQLEVNMQEMKTQQAKFQTWCNDAAGQIGQLGTTMTAQDQRLTMIEGQVTKNTQATQSLSSQITSLNSSFASELATAMEKQTAHIDAMLNKKLRTS